MWDRCITRRARRHVPRGIQQRVPSSDAWLRGDSLRDDSEGRIIPIDGRRIAPELCGCGTTRAQVGQGIRLRRYDQLQQRGGSRRRREDTSRAFLETESLHRRALLLVDANTIDYEATIDDPKMFARPWKCRPAAPRFDVRIYEYVP